MKTPKELAVSRNTVYRQLRKSGLEYLLQQPDPQQTCHAIFLAARCVGEVRKRNELGLIVGEVLDRVKA